MLPTTCQYPHCSCGKHPMADVTCNVCGAFMPVAHAYHTTKVVCIICATFEQDVLHYDVFTLRARRAECNPSRFIDYSANYAGGIYGYRRHAMSRGLARRMIYASHPAPTMSADMTPDACAYSRAAADPWVEGCRANWRNPTAP